MEIGSFLLGVFWGVCMLAVFIYLILVSGVVILGENGSLFTDNLDSLDMLLQTPRILGVSRTLVWVVIAAVWPVVILIGVVLAFLYLEKEELPPRLDRILEWFFLGFGKFVPPKAST